MTREENKGCLVCTHREKNRDKARRPSPLPRHKIKEVEISGRHYFLKMKEQQPIAYCDTYMMKKRRRRRISFFVCNERKEKRKTCLGIYIIEGAAFLGNISQIE